MADAAGLTDSPSSRRLELVSYRLSQPGAYGGLSDRLEKCSCRSLPHIAHRPASQSPRHSRIGLRCWLLWWLLSWSLDSSRMPRTFHVSPSPTRLPTNLTSSHRLRPTRCCHSSRSSILARPKMLLKSSIAAHRGSCTFERVAARHAPLRSLAGPHRRAIHDSGNRRP